MIFRGSLQSFPNRVVFLGSFHGDFREGLKSIPFNWVKSSKLIDPPQWWSVIDADDVYVDNPRSFLAKVPRRFARVCANTVELLNLNNPSDLLNPYSYDDFIPLMWSEVDSTVKLQLLGGATTVIMVLRA